MLESMRVFVSYLVFVVDQSQRVTLATIAVLVFASVIFGGPLARRFGPRVGLGVAVGLLLVSRLVLQFWEQPEARLILGALGVIAWGWLLIVLVVSARRALALGLPRGRARDLAIRIAFRTVDLPWMPGFTAHAITVVLALALLAAALSLMRRGDLSGSVTGTIFPLVAIGPGLAVYHLMIGNLGYAQTSLDVDFPRASLVMAIGAALGLLLVALLLADLRAYGAWLRGPFALLAIALLVVLSAWMFWRRSPLSEIGLIAGIAGSFVLLAFAVLGGRAERTVSTLRVAVWVTGGMLLQAGLIFAYYSFSGLPVVIVVAWGMFLVIALFSSGQSRNAEGERARWLALPVGVVVLLLAAATVWQALDWSEPQAGPPASANLRVMTYNIQSGFSVDNHWSLENTARTIEAADPDIVVLEEVSRGWLVTTGVDEMTWLSQRLDMPYVFGANSDDHLWGNAILARAPLSHADVQQYTTTENLQRSVVVAQVATEAGGVWIFGTHFDNPGDAAATRLEQADQLLAVWNGRTPAIIFGDLNTEPTSDTIRRFTDAGFTDIGSALPPDAYTSEDHRRIDYILTSPGITPTNITIPDTWHSDHRPVVATVRVGGT
jgi:endonuclease/exonuclease/phosphatase family metal-dependent hydrolase